MSSSENFLAGLEEKKEELQAKIEEASLNIKIDIEEQLMAVVKHLEGAGIKALRWEQFTPYFNDGDVCRFEIYGLDFLLMDDEEIDTYSYHQRLYMSVDKEERQKSEDIEEFMDFMRYEDQSIFRNGLGDHMKITVYADRIEKEEYTEHE